MRNVIRAWVTTSLGVPERLGRGGAHSLGRVHVVQSDQFLQRSNIHDNGVVDSSPIGDALRRDTTLKVGERRLVPPYRHGGFEPQVRFNERHWDLAATPAGPLPNTGSGERLSR